MTKRAKSLRDWPDLDYQSSSDGELRLFDLQVVGVVLTPHTVDARQALFFSFPPWPFICCLRACGYIRLIG